jgi:hypothetical protein
MNQSNKDPSFEEILASVRRVVAQTQTGPPTPQPKPIHYGPVNAIHLPIGHDDDFQLPAMFRVHRMRSDGVARSSQPTFVPNDETRRQVERWLKVLQTVARSMVAREGAPAPESRHYPSLNWPEAKAVQPSKPLPRRMPACKDTLINRMGQPQRRPEYAIDLETSTTHARPCGSQFGHGPKNDRITGERGPQARVGIEAQMPEASPREVATPGLERAQSQDAVLSDSTSRDA